MITLGCVALFHALWSRSVLLLFVRFLVRFARPASFITRQNPRMLQFSPFLFKLTWLALGVDHAEPSRGGEQATALGRL